MTHLNQADRGRPTRSRTRITLLAAIALAGCLSNPSVAAASFRFSFPRTELADADGRAQARSRIARAARSLCGSDGVAAVHRNGARRCRAAVLADAERQMGGVSFRVVIGSAE